MNLEPFNFRFLKITLTQAFVILIALPVKLRKRHIQESEIERLKKYHLMGIRNWEC